MSDVLQKAQKYYDRLKFEIGKVEDFLRLAETLMNEGAAETYAPVTNPVMNKVDPEAYTPLTNPAPRTMPSAPRAEDLPRPAVNEAAAVKAEATPASNSNGRASIFCGSFEHFGPERHKDVA